MGRVSHDAHALSELCTSTYSQEDERRELQAFSSFRREARRGRDKRRERTSVEVLADLVLTASSTNRRILKASKRIQTGGGGGGGQWEDYPVHDSSRARELHDNGLVRHWRGIVQGLQRSQERGEELVVTHHQHHVDREGLDTVEKDVEAGAIYPATSVYDDA